MLEREDFDLLEQFMNLSTSSNISIEIIQKKKYDKDV